MNTSVFQFLEPAGYLFYIVNPKRHIYESVEDVPDYIAQATPFFAAMIFIEQLVLFSRSWKRFTVSDTLVSIFQGILMEQSKLLFKSFIVVHYIQIYQSFALLRLENTQQNWIVALISLDFVFYWFHRACHEVNILWAFHQTHHSSENFNFSTALRQSIVQVYIHCFFNLPLALFISPPIYMVHLQLNVLYQFWIHTDLVPKLGPIEWVFNTPSAHRVHHGRNQYCIDKNYGGVLLIWDRIFGTFQKEENEIAYGLVHPINTFNPLLIQGWNLAYIWQRLKSTSSNSERFSILFKGPGWSDGTPRFGSPNDIPVIDTKLVKKFDPKIPLWATLYVGLHFILILIFHVIAIDSAFSWRTLVVIIFLAISIYSLSKLLQGDLSFATELFRCLSFFAINEAFDPLMKNSGLLSTQFPIIQKIIFGISAFIWVIRAFSLAQKRIEKTA